MNPLDALTAAVTAETGAADSIITLVGGLSDYIRAHSADPAAMTALADSLNAKKQAILDAVAANPVPGEALKLGGAKKK
jgi:hypothetical protein